MINDVLFFFLVCLRVCNNKRAVVTNNTKPRAGPAGSRVCPVNCCCRRHRYMTHSASWVAFVSHCVQQRPSSPVQFHRTSNSCCLLCCSLGLCVGKSLLITRSNAFLFLGGKKFNYVGWILLYFLLLIVFYVVGVVTCGKWISIINWMRRHFVIILLEKEKTKKFPVYNLLTF